MSVTLISTISRVRLNAGACCRRRCAGRTLAGQRGSTRRPGSRPRSTGGANSPAEAERLLARGQLRSPILLVYGGSGPQPLRPVGHSCMFEPLAPKRLAQLLASVQRTATTRNRP